MIRFFDIFFSFIGLTLLSPFLILICILIKLTSKGPVLYKQERVGLLNINFSLWKFRTMIIDADKSGFLTVGVKDSRITTLGYYLRKYKIDEIPQLFNVLFGNMSLVGPRPEVRKYVDKYSVEQLVVLNVKPGITDWASIEFLNESDLLITTQDPEYLYISFILPRKIQLNMRYIEDRRLKEYFKIIFLTCLRIYKQKSY